MLQGLGFRVVSFHLPVIRASSPVSTIFYLGAGGLGVCFAGDGQDSSRL